jgi:citrate lyase subunit gamma (acyl carrier protein)
MVVVSPSDGYALEYGGPNEVLFKRRTERIVREIAERCASGKASVQVQDRGALEVTLRARVETAFERASASKEDLKKADLKKADL